MEQPRECVRVIVDREEMIMPLELKYFVLKPAGRSPHAYAARDAMRTYAESIKFHDEMLAKSLHEWADDERRRAHAQGGMAIGPDREILSAALLSALDLIKRNHMVTMGAMAVPEEIERSWRDRCRTTPEQRGIFDALGEKP